MFEYEKREEGYYIFMDNIKGKFGPFKGVFIKNKYLGKINELEVNEYKFPGYKYSIGKTTNSMFIISKNGEVEII